MLMQMQMIINNYHSIKGLGTFIHEMVLKRTG
jgi:hypothetical protein